jgi:hypothetical protein
MLALLVKGLDVDTAIVRIACRFPGAEQTLITVVGDNSNVTIMTV